jgi:hypothetical protein
LVAVEAVEQVLLAGMQAEAHRQVALVALALRQVFLVHL